MDDFVREFLCPTFRRPIGPGSPLRWSARWWESAEAIIRLDALWRAWEALRLDPATAALLRKQHPDWDAAKVGRCIVDSAGTLTGDVTEVGAFPTRYAPEVDLSSAADIPLLDGGGMSLAGTAMLLAPAAQTKDPGMAQSLILRQMLNLMKAIADTHLAAGDARRYQGIERVVRDQLVQVARTLPSPDQAPAGAPAGGPTQPRTPGTAAE